ncbi:hypothetical protein EG19_10200 [Thermoanaerobaculum aquaticum]|uniref:Uncharacterized protein n=1 Tax=Thermoanaerobaculum aquaticum TaxID=1312852 RepID=A0A062XYM0_9BACT|nr:DUF2298 domain-containing protein [Thermoanaerobaculum aquaticum]KDA54529.1 hypothetical protein EG19_10200 [Thermoanaerobaculum aquaticum]
MTLLFQGFAWYGLLFVGGVAGFPLAKKLVPSGLGAWACARLVGFAIPAFLCWYLGLAGLTGWVWVALPVVAFGVFWGTRNIRQEQKTIVELEAVGLAAFWLLVLLRSQNFAVTGTEKPMDLAILASLMRPQALPPGDPWFAGYPLPYYYWGFLPWTLPARLSGFFPDEVFNLLVPTLAGLTAQLAYAWARTWDLGKLPATAAAASSVFLGTTDGWVQLLKGEAGFFTSNLWDASRGIAHTITEFPLFTYHLGDLHPHLLCQPWILGCFLLWTGTESLRWPLKLLVRALFFGVVAATNPWAVPFLGLSLAALLWATTGRTFHAGGEALLAGLLAFALFFPAWASLPAGASGLGWVTTPTTLGEIGRVLLPALIPSLVFAAWFFFKEHRLLGLPAAFLGFVVVALASARPLVALALTLAVAALWFAIKNGDAKPAAAILASCLAGLMLMELVYLKDPYGPEWYRMNTVFKTLSFVFLVLPVPSIRLLALAQNLGFPRALRWLILPWALSLPQLATLARSAWPPPPDFSGLYWMAPGEAEAAHFLHRTSASEILVEGIGPAYSDAARLSAASGVPAVLGWENHEGLWRRPEFGPLIADRSEKVSSLYRCQEVECVQGFAAELGATLLVVGSVERRLYPEMNEEVLKNAGDVAFASGEVTLIRLAPPLP